MSEPNAKTPDDYFREWEHHVFGFGYGTGEQFTIPALRSFLALCTEGPNGSIGYDHCTEGIDDTVRWLVINALGHADIIEYGTSPRYGWLTPEGKRLREYLLSKTDDELYNVATSQTHDDMRPDCFPDYCNCVGTPCSNPFWISRRPRIGAHTHNDDTPEGKMSDAPRPTETENQTMITANEAQLASIFTEWERRYREEPERFQSEAAKLLRETPQSYGELCAPYFLQIAREIGAS